MGIELYWRTAKHRYRQSIDQCRANNNEVNQIGLVEQINDSISDDHAQQCAIQGLATL